MPQSTNHTKAVCCLLWICQLELSERGKMPFRQLFCYCRIANPFIIAWLQQKEFSKYVSWKLPQDELDKHIKYNDNCDCVLVALTLWAWTSIYCRNWDYVLSNWPWTSWENFSVSNESLGWLIGESGLANIQGELWVADVHVGDSAVTVLQVGTMVWQIISARFYY